MANNKTSKNKTKTKTKDKIKEKVKSLSEEERLSYMNELVDELGNIYESDRTRVTKSKKLIDFAHECHNDEYEGIGYYSLAIYYNASQSQYPLFKPTDQKAIELLKDTEQYRILTSCYTLLGVDAINFGQYNLNMDYFLLARHYAELANELGVIAMVEYYLAGFYMVLQDFDTAMKYAKNSLKLMKKAGNNACYFGSNGIDMAYCMLGVCYVFQGRFDKAIDCYKNSLKQEKTYTPRYDCPNTALIYAFHIMALHVSFDFKKRDAACDDFLDLLSQHKPSPSMFMHLVNTNLFLINIGSIKYAKAFLPFLSDANKVLKNPNFGLLIAFQKSLIAQKENDEKAMLLALREHFDYSIKNNALVLENIRTATALRVEIDDIQKERNELQIQKASNEAKEYFLSNVSHEIRTPLNAILGMDEIIMRQTREDETYKYAADIKNAGNTLLGIVNDILDSSKLDAGKMDIIPVEYDLSSVINDLVNMVSQRIKDKGLEFKVEVDPDIPYLLFGDEIRIKQCVLNILTNALKYTEKGTISLYISAHFPDCEEMCSFDKKHYKNTDGTSSKIGNDIGSKKGLKPVAIRYRVVDTGIGIKEEDLDKLTRPFERIEEKRNRTIEGTGLGMSIVQRLLQLMGTKLEVKSVYGEGSDFSFEILQGTRSKEPLGDYARRYKELSQKREKYVSSFTAPNAKVLIVDDTPANLTVAKGLLKPIGLMVDTATSGMETLEKVKTNRYDILFIDHRMPQMDGVETLKALKKQKENMSKGAVNIVLTANVISGARDMFMGYGFDDYLSKPIDTVKLERMLLDYLPKELIEQASDADITADSEMTTQNDEAPSKDSFEESDPVFERLKEIPEIDLKEALKSCGGNKDILIDTMRDFVMSVKTSPDKIEEYCKKGDIKNYTIMVHGLKSAARFIGATDLSDSAAYLESCGDDNNILQINSMTPYLLADYKKLGDRLEQFFSDTGIEVGMHTNEKDADDSKPEIDKDTLLGVYAGIKEFVDAYDFKCAEDVLGMLLDYRLSDEDKHKVDKLYELIRNVDHDGIMELL